MTTTEYEHNVVLATGEYDVIGTRPIRPDGVDKVTGRALYGADFQTAGLLHGRTLRSPHAHARIILSRSRAKRLPPLRASPLLQDCTRFSRHSWSTRRCNAASAHQGLSLRQRRC